MRQQGKYGWYPCDWATYRKLKALNIDYDKALHEKARWERWERKEPQNRVVRAKLKDSKGNVVGYAAAIPQTEPEITSIFLTKVVRKTQWKNGKYYKDGIDETVVELTSLPIFEDYWKSRYPVAGEEGVSSLSMNLDLINELYNKLK
jgi:hypothetical protein